MEEQLSPANEPIEGLDDLSEATSSEAAATDSAPETPAEATYKIGGQDYTESQLGELIDDATNAKRFITEATQRSQDAKATLAQVEAIKNDPRYQQAEEVLALLEDPAIAARFQNIYAQATGAQPMNTPGYDPAVPGLMHKISALEQQMAQTAEARNESEAGRCAAEFAQWVKDEYGQDMSPDELNEWVEQDFIPNTSDDVRGYADNLEYMKFHWNRTNGREDRRAQLAAIREEIRAEVVQSLRDGKDAALVTPTDHQEIPFKPSGKMDDVMMEAFEAARNDPSVKLDGDLL